MQKIRLNLQSTMISSKIDETNSEIRLVEKDNDVLRIQLNRKQLLLKKDQCLGHSLQLQVARMEIQIDELNKSLRNLNVEIQKSNRVKNDLRDLLTYFRSYTIVGNIRYKIKSLFGEDSINHVTNDEDDIIWED